MITVTRTLQADVPDALRTICKAMGYVRADIWRRYGALGTVGKSANDIRKEISAAHGPFPGPASLSVHDDPLLC